MILVYFQKVEVDSRKLNHHINMEMFMNPAPHSAWKVCNYMPQLFAAFSLPI